ncbi:MAG: hypothetical protein PHI12_06430 [Dehalococcoidales bacterium]|nr:hypothetical protein [Dehalococcoidales bacterium]
MKRILVAVEIDTDLKEEPHPVVLSDLEAVVEEDCKEWGFDAKVKAELQDDVLGKYTKKWLAKEVEAREEAEKIERINRWVERSDFLKIKE